MANAYFRIQTERRMIGCDTIKIIYGIKFVFYRPSSFPVFSKLKENENEKENERRQYRRRRRQKEDSYSAENAAAAVATIQTVINDFVAFLVFDTHP